MNVLPLTHLSETDQPIFGVNLVNLSRLGRSGLPVLPGVAVSPPALILETLLEHIRQKDREVFEQRLEFLKAEIKKIPASSEFSAELGKAEGFLLNGSLIKEGQALWERLLGVWLDEIRSKIWREGFTSGITASLSSQAVFFEGKKLFFVRAHSDPESKETVIEAGERLEPAASHRIEELVRLADKKLFLPQVYVFAVRKRQVWLVGLYPFTQPLAGSTKEEIVLPGPAQKRMIKSAVKVFLNLSQGFAPAEPDGVLMEGEKVPDFETAVFKISEASSILSGGPVIYKLPDIADGEIRGSLRLINQKSLLISSCKLFNFVRHARNLLNVELAVPLTRSVEEFAQLKRELAAQGIARKGTMKLWLELGTPENFINLNQYLEAGLDGVIINLEYLQKCLSGFDHHEAEHYRRETKAVAQFLEPFFKVLHKARIPVLVKGGLTFDSEILHFLVEKGVWGVVVNSPLEATNLPEHLNWVEKRVLSQRLS